MSSEMRWVFAAANGRNPAVIETVTFDASRLKRISLGGSLETTVARKIISPASGTRRYVEPGFTA